MRVYNWQIGREMEYPYPAAHPRKQFVFVFDLNRCTGCHACSIGCKSAWTFSRGQELMWWSSVETRPYGGTPQGWDVKILSLLHDVHRREGVEPRWDATGRRGTRSPYGSYFGLTLIEAAQKTYGDAPEDVLGTLPPDDEWRYPNLYEDVPTSGRPPWLFYLPRLCNHCEYPYCLAACPRKAIYKRPADGIVLIDPHRCRGYKKCVAACPYKKAVFRPGTRLAEKCVGCFPRLEDGAPAACFAACAKEAALHGFVEIREDGQWSEAPDNPLYCLVREEKIALPLYPQFGTQPAGYYIPPRWVPRDFLRQMFGPGVDGALEALKAPSRRVRDILHRFGRHASRV